MLEKALTDAAKRQSHIGIELKWFTNYRSDIVPAHFQSLE